MNKSYYAIIPANVRYDRDLNANAKLLYGEITALCNEKGYCWATNEYFADLYNVSKVSVGKWISLLVEKGYINRQIKYAEGTKQILDRYLSLVGDPHKEKFDTPHKEKFVDNNTVFNTKINTTQNISLARKNLFEEFIKIFNQAIGRHYKGDTKSFKQFCARLDDGYTIEDFTLAACNASKDPHHVDSHYKWLTPELITRNDKLDRFINMQHGYIDSSPAASLHKASNQIQNIIDETPDEHYESLANKYAAQLGRAAPDQ